MLIIICLSLYIYGQAKFNKTKENRNDKTILASLIKQIQRDHEHEKGRNVEILFLKCFYSSPYFHVNLRMTVCTF